VKCLDCQSYAMKGCPVPGFGHCNRESSRARVFSPSHACHRRAEFQAAPADTVARRLAHSKGSP